MRVFVHEDLDKSEEICECDKCSLYKNDKENIYILNKSDGEYIFIIYAIEVQGKILREDDRIYIYSIENRTYETETDFYESNMECWIGDNQKLEDENLILMNSMFEKENISDILLNKYIIIIPGGGIVIKLENYKNINIFYKKRKM